MTVLVTTDDELMARAKAGEHAAFEEIVRRHQRRVLAIALRLLRDPVLARDASQRAFMELYKLVPRYHARDRLNALIGRVVINQAKMLQRSASRRLRAMEAAAEQHEVAPHRAPDVAPDAKIGLERAVAALPAPLGQVIALRYAGGLSLAEVAEALDIPLGTAKSRLAAGLTELRRRLGTDPW